MFSALPNINFNFWVSIILSSANALNLVKSLIILFGKEWRHDKIIFGCLVRNKSYFSIHRNVFTIGLKQHAKSIHPAQSAQPSQADLGRNFLHLVYFLHAEGQFYFIMQTVIKHDEFHWTVIWYHDWYHTLLRCNKLRYATVWLIGKLLTWSDRSLICCCCLMFSLVRWLAFLWHSSLSVRKVCRS